mgnify:CR=1 FL=1
MKKEEGKEQKRKVNILLYIVFNSQDNAKMSILKGSISGNLSFIAIKCLSFTGNSSIVPSECISKTSKGYLKYPKGLFENKVDISLCSTFDFTSYSL